MDSGETHEPSYYEVALTNRQVLIAFVALLTCLLVAFLSGVWIGRDGAAEAASPSAMSVATQAAAAEPPLEQLTFFNGTGGEDRRNPAALPDPVAEKENEKAPPSAPRPAASEQVDSVPDASDSMRENLEATMEANRQSPALKLAVGERTGSPAEAPAPPLAPVEKVPAETRSAPGNVFVQVYSSTNGARAREIAAQLRKAGFRVVLGEAPKGSAKTFRVRVGPYATKAQADADATRLRRDHRLDTWVTDSP